MHQHHQPQLHPQPQHHQQQHHSTNITSNNSDITSNNSNTCTNSPFNNNNNSTDTIRTNTIHDTNHKLTPTQNRQQQQQHQQQQQQQQQQQAGDGVAVLRYFKARGRAEALRLTLEELAIPYREERYSPEEWQGGIKNQGIGSGLFAFGQLPSLSIDGRDYVQSMAILRVLGRRGGIYGRDHVRASEIDVVIEGLIDLRTKFNAVAYGTGEIEVLAKDYLTNVVPTWLNFFEALLARNHEGADEYFVSSTLSIADILAFDTMTQHLGLDSTCLGSYLRLSKFVRSMTLRPRINAYLRSERRPQHMNGDKALFGNSKRPENIASNPVNTI